MIFLYALTSCRDSVIGSFSSVSSSSNTGLVEVDGSFSTFLSIFRWTWRKRKYTNIMEECCSKTEKMWSCQNAIFLQNKSRNKEQDMCKKCYLCEMIA